MVTPLPSFIEIAPESHFSLQNLPYGIFRPNDGPARAGVAIGDLVLDLAALEEAGCFHTLHFGERAIFTRDSLNAFLALGRPVWRRTREILQHLLVCLFPVLQRRASNNLAASQSDYRKCSDSIHLAQHYVVHVRLRATEFEGNLYGGKNLITIRRLLQCSTHS